jgi:uncharacterized phage protein (TIGR01671 family)
MPRELKFRAWHPEYGWAGLSVITLRNCVTGSEPYFDNYDEWTWEQYTGLKDKNGTEIYEGDDLEYRGKFRETVEWRTTEKTEVEGHGSYSMRKFTGFYFSGYYGLPENAEVVGNIHE